MQRTTKAILWARGFLTAIGAVGVFLMAQEDFRKLVTPGQFLVAGAFFVAAQAVLGFMDRSLGQHQADKAPELGSEGKPVMVAADKPLPTIEQN